jgi:two-component system, NtrC family, sensor kinase
MLEEACAASAVATGPGAINSRQPGAGQGKPRQFRPHSGVAAGLTGLLILVAGVCGYLLSGHSSHEYLGIGVSAAGALLTAVLLGLRRLHLQLLRATAQLQLELQEARSQVAQQSDQQAQLRAQLVHSGKLAGLGTLTAGIVHEISNPVGFVSGNLGALEEYAEVLRNLVTEYEALRKALPPDARPAVQGRLSRIDSIRAEENIDYILQDVGQLLSDCNVGLGQIKDVLEGVRSFAGMRDGEMREADINQGVEQTLKLVWNELKYKCQVHTDLKPLPPVRCLSGEVNQVIMNLLINAANAIPEKGDVNVGTRPAGDGVTIRVADTGDGIRPDLLDRVFDPLFSTKPASMGMGLGLSVSRDIVARHGGTIEVESEPDVGTTFTVYLPLSPPEKPRAEATGGPEC